MDKKFISVSHQDIINLHRGILGAESMVHEESEIEFAQDSIT